MSDMPETYSTTYGSTELLSSDQVVNPSIFESIKRFIEEWGLYQFISLIAVVLFCICIVLCVICCKCNRSPYKDPNKHDDVDDSATSSSEDIPQSTNEHQTFKRHQHEYLAIMEEEIEDGQTDNDVDIYDYTHTAPLTMEETTTVVHIDADPAKAPLCDNIIGDAKEIESEHKTEDDSSSNSSRSSELYDSGTSPTGNTQHDGMEKARMTPRGSAELPPFHWAITHQGGQLIANPVNNAHLHDGNDPGTHKTPGHTFPTPCAYYSNYYPPYGPYVVVPDLPPSDNDNGRPRGESDIKEKEEDGEEPKLKVTWDENKVSQWVGSRGEKYQTYVQGVLDHGINGRSLCRYGKDEAELIKVFGKVVSDDFHRNKLVTDWIELP
eukprot:483802_1